jgi:hypothetical protein
VTGGTDGMIQRAKIAKGLARPRKGPGVSLVDGAMSKRGRTMPRWSKPTSQDEGQSSNSSDNPQLHK